MGFWLLFLNNRRMEFMRLLLFICLVVYCNTSFAIIFCSSGISPVRCGRSSKRPVIQVGSFLFHAFHPSCLRWSWSEPTFNRFYSSCYTSCYSGSFFCSPYISAFFYQSYAFCFSFFDALVQLSYFCCLTSFLFFSFHLFDIFL